MGDAGARTRVVSGRKVALLLKLCRTLAGVSQTRLAELMTVMFQEQIKVRDISLFENGKWGDDVSHSKDFSLKVLVWMDVMGVRYHSLIMMKEWDLESRKRTVGDLSIAELHALEEFHKMSPTLSIQNLQILGILLGLTPEDIHCYFRVRRSSKDNQDEKPSKCQSRKSPSLQDYTESHNRTPVEGASIQNSETHRELAKPRACEIMRPEISHGFHRPCANPVPLPPASTFLSVMKPLRSYTPSAQRADSYQGFVLNDRTEAIGREPNPDNESLNVSFTCGPPDLQLEYSDVSNDSGFSDNEIAPAFDSWLFNKPEAVVVGTQIEEKEESLTNATYTPLSPVESVHRRASIQQALDNLRYNWHRE